MQQAAIFGPMFAMFALTFAVWTYMFCRRIPWITASQLTPEQLQPDEFTRLQPPHVRNPADNLKNLFELPVLFYALCLYLHATGSVDTLYLVAAWIFVAFRVLHSLMHCTKNVVMVRFALYLVASLALWFAIGRAALGLPA